MRVEMVEIPAMKIFCRMVQFTSLLIDTTVIMLVVVADKKRRKGDEYHGFVFIMAHLVVWTVLTVFCLCNSWIQFGIVLSYDNANYVFVSMYIRLFYTSNLFKEILKFM
ncbi:hypothetical protein JTE90_016530 [Oedothorax gibbosus]|uniref:Uncharacterized protein n=1 Tax=Oedothorax gibbosus TaxID=931172 RepID=A0AAV6UY66_9ARAC|nr:hypothetical protein JTE90_016530 [Oedothorax gibbosus]